MNDKEERLAQALRTNLHRRKAQSRARRSGEDDQARRVDGQQTQSSQIKTDSVTGTEQDHGQAED